MIKRSISDKGISLKKINYLPVTAALTVIGIKSIGLSGFYDSSYLAIEGVSITFWSAVLLYIAPTRQIPANFSLR